MRYRCQPHHRLSSAGNDDLFPALGLEDQTGKIGLRLVNIDFHRRFVCLVS